MRDLLQHVLVSREISAWASSEGFAPYPSMFDELTSCCGDGKARPWSGGLGSLPFVAPQLLAPTPQRRRATARQRRAAAATITGTYTFLAGPWPSRSRPVLPRPARPHPGHRWPCPWPDRPVFLLRPPHLRRARHPHPPAVGHPPHRCLGGESVYRC